MVSACTKWDILIQCIMSARQPHIDTCHSPHIDAYIWPHSHTVALSSVHTLTCPHSHTLKCTSVLQSRIYTYLCQHSNLLVHTSVSTQPYSAATARCTKSAAAPASRRARTSTCSARTPVVWTAVSAHPARPCTRASASPLTSVHVRAAPRPTTTAPPSRTTVTLGQ